MSNGGESNGDEGCGVLLLVIVIIAIIGASTSNSTKSPPSVSPNTQTWQQYAQSPTNGDVTAQLANTQNLLIALGNDVSRLQSQNVDIQTALATVNAQVAFAQQQAQEESKHQNVLAWVTTIVGAFIGFFIERVWKFIKGLFFGKDAKKQNAEGKTSTQNPVEINPISQYKPHVASQSLSQNLKSPSVILCPKCGKFMVTRTLPSGKKSFVCPDSQCRQEFPMDLG